MSRVTCHQSTSADGYAAGPNQTEERPFGDDGGDGWGNRLHAWMFDNPEENRAEIDQRTAARAYIMGEACSARYVASGIGSGRAGGVTIRRSTPRPSCLLTHHPRDLQPMDGGTTYRSSPTESSRHWPRRARRPATAMSIEGGASEHHQSVPRRRPDRRTAAAHRAAHARRRHPAIRRCPAPESRAGGFAGSELGHTRDLSRAVLNRRGATPKHSSEPIVRVIDRPEATHIRYRVRR